MAAADKPFRFPATFTFVVRSFSVLDGIGKSLSPRFDITEISAPYARGLLLEGAPQKAALQKELKKRLGKQVLSLLPLADVALLRTGWPRFANGSSQTACPICCLAAAAASQQVLLCWLAGACWCLLALPQQGITRGSFRISSVKDWAFVDLRRQQSCINSCSWSD